MKHPSPDRIREPDEVDERPRGGMPRRAGAACGGRRRALRAASLVLVLLACKPPVERPPEAGGGGAAEDTAAAEAAAALDFDWPEGLSPDAKLETYESLQLDLDAKRHPSDGAGRAWIERVEVAGEANVFAPAPVNAQGEAILGAGSRARFHVVFEVGPEGVAKGGGVFLQVSPFWDWDGPQTSWEDGPGYTEVTTSADGVELVPVETGQPLLIVGIEGRALSAGEQIRFTFGAGPAGARVDTYAEHEARLWIAVDGDGDGVRSVLLESPVVQIVARSPARLVLTAPTTAREGESVRVTAAVLDVMGNAGVRYEGVMRLDESDALELPRTLEFGADDHGLETFTARVLRDGVHRIRASITDASGSTDAESNPIVVETETTRVFWADLHGHSNFSDGTGTPEDYFAYARDVAALDVVALTDHDHWGMRFLDARPEMWQRIREATMQFHEPGRFVTLLGYEWTSWLHGHRHVLYFSDEGDILSSLDPRYQTPAELWAGLSGRAALTFAHHSAGGPVATNWNFAPPPELEPVTEIASVHGSSEAEDSPGLIYRPVRGNFVRDALARGYRLGFIGSGDSHDGHPGLARLASGSRTAGLAAIRATELTRESVLAALRARRTYATNGPRIHLSVHLEDGEQSYEMGARVPASERAASTQILRFRIVGTAPIERVDFIRSGLTASEDGDGTYERTGEREIPRLATGEYVYLRVVQVDGGTAWSSPIYAD